jgi:hypothetical protein
VCGDLRHNHIRRFADSIGIFLPDHILSSIAYSDKCISEQKNVEDGQSANFMDFVNSGESRAIEEVELS